MVFGKYFEITIFYEEYLLILTTLMLINSLICINLSMYIRKIMVTKLFNIY